MTVTNLFRSDQEFAYTCKLCGYEVWHVTIDDPNDPCELKLYCGNEDCANEHTVFYLEDQISFDSSEV